MTTARNVLSALILTLLPLACEAAHIELPLHGHDEELVEEHVADHAGSAAA